MRVMALRGYASRQGVPLGRSQLQRNFPDWGFASGQRLHANPLSKINVDASRLCAIHPHAPAFQSNRNRKSTLVQLPELTKTSAEKGMDASTRLWFPNSPARAHAG